MLARNVQQLPPGAPFQAVQGDEQVRRCLHALSERFDHLLPRRRQRRVQFTIAHAEHRADFFHHQADRGLKHIVRLHLHPVQH